MRDELVVVRPRLVGCTQDERATVHSNLLGPLRDVSVRALVTDRVLDLGPELEGLQHRLLVLQLVLEHQAEHEALPEERPGAVELGVLERLQDARPDLERVCPGGLGPERRYLRAPVSRLGESRGDVAVRVQDRAHGRRGRGAARAPRSARCGRAPTTTAAAGVKYARRAPRPRQERGARRSRLGPDRARPGSRRRIPYPGLCTMVASSAKVRKGAVA